MPESHRPASGIPSAAFYRQKALKLRETARTTNDPFVRAELESLAQIYMRLADKSGPIAMTPDSGAGTLKPEKE